MTMQLYNYRKKRKRRLSRTVCSHSHHRHHHRRRRHRSPGRRAGKAVLITAVVLLVIAAAGFGGFTILRSTGKSDLMKYAGAVQMDLKDAQDESGLVSKNGKKYRYNEDIITLLCMGVDQGSESWEEARSEGENGQADAIFLAVLDQKAHSLKLIGISRDTMTDIATYDRQGNYVGESRNHLALAFSYGTSKQEGAELVKDAVSNLFYHLPIHGYVAIDWDALGKINDSVGGVAVTLTEDMILAGEPYSEGDTVRLNAEQTKSYVRYRGDALGSNNARMNRQKTYASAFIQEASAAIRKDPLLVADLYQELTSDMATSIGVNEAVYLASLLPSIQFDMEDIQMVEGKIRQGARYEEFYADEEKLMDLILETFYQEVQER